MLIFLMQIVISGIFLLTGFYLLLGVVQIRKFIQTENQDNLKNHRILMRDSLYLVLIGVVFVEVFISLIGRERSWLLWLHLGFAVPFLLLLLDLNFHHTGLRTPSLHRKLGYFCIYILYLGMTATGAILLFSKAG